MKQFEYLTHSPGFIREVRRDSRGQFIEYDELQELGKQGWELAAAQPGGKWIFKRETESAPGLDPHKTVKPSVKDFEIGR
jgi:hypothetical protein